MIVIGLALVLLVTKSDYSISTAIYCSTSNTSAINYTPTIYASPTTYNDTIYESDVCFLCALFIYFYLSKFL